MEAVIKMPVRSSRKSLQLGQALALVFSRSFGSSKLCQGAQPYVLFRTSSSLGFFERQSELSETDFTFLTWLVIADCWLWALIGDQAKRRYRHYWPLSPHIGTKVAQKALSQCRFWQHAQTYHNTLYFWCTAWNIIQQYIHHTTILDQRPARTKFAFLQRWCQIKQPPAREAGEACSAAVW